MPGGGGVRLKYSNPMCVDDVAADFPELDIILAHPSFPWQDEALAIAVHKPNVYIDLSGWSPKYFPENLIRYTNTQLKHKMLFGSDYPLITPDRWLARLREAADPRRGAPAGAQGERGPAARAMSDLGWPLQRAAALHADATAVIDGERRVTLWRARAAGQRARRARRDRGSASSARNSLAHLECWLGVPAAGKRARRPQLPARARGARVHGATTPGIELLIADAERRAVAETLGVDAARATTRRSWPGRRWRRRGIDEDALAAISYTGGTTGHAEGRDAQPPQPAGQRAAQPRRHRPHGGRPLAARVPDVPRRRHRRTSSPARGWARPR